MSNWKFLPTDTWDESCMICGSAVEVNTERDDLSLLYEDDEVRCSNEDCRAEAQVIVYDEIANLHWKEETSKKFKNE